MSNPKKTKLIIVTAYYPPIKSVASQRLYAIAKYIDKNKYHVFVFFPYDKDIISDIEGVTLVPVRYKCLIRYASFDKNTSYVVHKIKALWNRVLINLGVSYFKGLKKPIIRAIEQHLDAEPFVVIASSPPVEVAQIGLFIKHKYSQARLIVDLRDALSNNQYIPKNQQNKCLLIENEILQKVDAIASVSGPIVANLQAKNFRKIPIVEIRNGFDFEARMRLHFNEYFTMIYAGTFYANRTPVTLFEAIERLMEQNLLSNWRLIFVGQSSAVRIPAKFTPYVERLEKVPYNESIKLIQMADALLLIHPPSNYKGVYTAKLFDYLGAMRPIIGLLDREDVAAQLIKECNAGFVADFYNIDEIEQAILAAYDLWRNKQVLPYNTRLIYLHHRSYQVKLFEHLIDTLLLNEQ